jgi:hypothetical protein
MVVSYVGTMIRKTERILASKRKDFLCILRKEMNAQDMTE